MPWSHVDASACITKPTFSTSESLDRCAQRISGATVPEPARGVDFPAGAEAVVPDMFYLRCGGVVCCEGW